MENENKPVQREYLFDNLKGLLIFLVVFGHTLEMYRGNIILKTIYLFIYTFHMPLFIFIAGYFSKNAEKCRKTAVGSFLIPYLIINTLFSIIATIIYSGRPITDIQIFTPGWALWFLLSMFIWKILLKDLAKIKYILFFSIAASLLLSGIHEFGNYMSLSRTIGFLFWFMLGYFYQNQDILAIRKTPKWVSIFIVVGIAILSYYFTKNNIIQPELFYFSESYASLSLRFVQGLIARSIAYLIAYIMLYQVINLMTNRQTFLSKIGQSSLTIYIFHTYIIMIIFKINPFEDQPFLNLIFLLILSVFITYILSLPFFKMLYDKFFLFFNRMLHKK